MTTPPGLFGTYRANFNLHGYLRTQYSEGIQTGLEYERAWEVVCVSSGQLVNRKAFLNGAATPPQRRGNAAATPRQRRANAAATVL